MRRSEPKGLIWGDARARARASAHLGDLLDVGTRDAAVDLEADVEARVVDHLARLARLVERARDERLAAEAGVDRHEQDDVDLVHHVPDEREILRFRESGRAAVVGVLEAVERRRRVEDEAALAARRADELERAVDLCCVDGVSPHAIDATLRRRKKRGETPPGGT